MLLLADYGKKEIINMVLLYLIAFIFISSIRILKILTIDTNYWLANTLNKSLLHYESAYTEKITCKRGQGYFLLNDIKHTAEQRENLKYCICTMWSMMHFFFYILLGYFSPSLFYVTLGIGILFEIVEYFTYDCHDILDILYNSLGFGVGYCLRYILKKKSGI